MPLGSLQGKEHVDSPKDLGNKGQRQDFDAVLTQELRQAERHKAADDGFSRTLPGSNSKKQGEAGEKESIHSDLSWFTLATVFLPPSGQQPVVHQVGSEVRAGMPVDAMDVTSFEHSLEEMVHLDSSHPPDGEVDAQAFAALMERETQVAAEQGVEGARVNEAKPIPREVLEAVPNKDVEFTESAPLDRPLPTAVKPLEQSGEIVRTLDNPGQVQPNSLEPQMGTLRPEKQSRSGESRSLSSDSPRVSFTEQVQLGEEGQSQTPAEAQHVVVVDEGLEQEWTPQPQSESVPDASRVSDEFLVSAPKQTLDREKHMKPRETLAQAGQIGEPKEPEPAPEKPVLDEGKLLDRSIGKVEPRADLREALEGAKEVQKESSRERKLETPSEGPILMDTATSAVSSDVPKAEAQIEEILDVQDRDNLFPKLVETIETLVHEERSEVRMQLKPDHLGTLEVKLSLERGIMVAEFVVQDQQVREILASHLPQLQTALQNQGTPMADVSVSIGLGQREADSQGQERSRSTPRSSYGRVQQKSAASTEKAYLGRSIWNQVDVRV